MAVVNYTRYFNRGTDREEIEWVLANGDTGQPVALSNYSDKTVHIFGTFGAGGSLSFEGSSDRALGAGNWVVLKDQSGNAITETAKAIEAVSPNCVNMRPNCTAGDGTTSITVVLTARKG